MTLFLALALLAALVSFIGSWAVWKFSLKYRLYPKIRERDVHTRPTPRLGGIAMFAGILVAFGAAWVVSNLGSTRFSNVAIIFENPLQVLSILGAALLIVLIGVADDLWDLDWMTKLAGQFLAAGLIAWQGVSIVSLPIGGGISVGSSWLFAVITIFTIVLVMNAVNFIDGLDGLVAGVTLIANGVFFVYTYLLVQQTSPFNYFNLASLIAIILVGALAGFLPPLNWHPAKLFMGDAGALLVGLLMATSAIAVTGQINPRAPVSKTSSRRSSRSSCRSRCSSSRSSTSRSPSRGACARASPRSRRTASTSTTGSSTWGGTRTCTPCSSSTRGRRSSRSDASSRTCCPSTSRCRRCGRSGSSASGSSCAPG